MTGDMINGIFEFMGALMIFTNVLRLLKDKQVRGVSPIPTVFFTSWGLFNLWFYPAHGLMWSFWGGVAIVMVNTAWLYLVIYYLHKEGRLKWRYMT